MFGVDLPMTHLPFDHDRPITYSEFRRAISEYRQSSLLHALAKYSAIRFNQNIPINRNEPIFPWAISMLAREALISPGRANRKSPTRRRVNDSDLRLLGALAFRLADPLTTRGQEPEAVDSFVVRTAYQQLDYQEPFFHGIARMRPMFNRYFPQDRFRVLSAQSLREVLGTSIDVFVDSAPFFVAAATANYGVFNTSWTEAEQFDEVRKLMSLKDLIKVFDTAWAASWDELRSEIISSQSENVELRQHDWNPFVGHPFVRMGDNQYLAPQAWFVASRVRPSAVYYLGVKRYGNTWAEDLGRAHEDYIRLQLDQLKPNASVYGEFQYRTGHGNALTVDAIVVMDHAIVLIEAKSMRARLDSRHTFSAYTEYLRRDLRNAYKQVATTSEMIRNNHAVFNGEIPTDRPICALVVTPEPLWLANNINVTVGYPDPMVPTAFISLRELEDLVAYGCVSHEARLWLDATSPDQDGNRNPHKALFRYQKEHGNPENPLLKQALAEGAWHD